MVLANTFYATSSTRRWAGTAGSTMRCGLMRERYGPMLARGATTLWESFEPTPASATASRPRRPINCRAACWAWLPGTGIYCCGYRARSGGSWFRTWSVSDQAGDIEVELERNHGGFEARVHSKVCV